MQIPEYFAKERMVTPRYARPPAGISDEGGGMEARAIAQFGATLGWIGRKFQQAKDVTDVTEAQTSILESFSNLENQYAQDQDYATMLERWNKDSDKLRKSVLKKKGLSGQARRAIEQRFDRDRVRFGGKIKSYARIRQIDQGRAKFLEGLEAIYKEGGELAESRVVALIEGTQSADYISAETAQKYKKDIPKTLEWYQIERLLYTNPDVVPEMIDAAEHLDPQEKNQLRSRARTAQSRRLAEQRAEYDKYVEETEQDWLVKLRGHQLTENEIYASTLEVDKKQEWLKYIDVQAKEILAGEDIITNEVVKGELESMAYDIWTGAISLSDFQKRLKAARYIDKTIDDNAYDEIFSLAQREYKTYQANTIKTAIDEAKMELVDLPGEMDIRAMIASIQARFGGLRQTEEIQRVLNIRQLQFWHHGQYRRALNEWFAKNPDATGDEIYIESKKLLSHYRRRGIPEIKKILSEREKRLFMVSPDAAEMKKKYPKIWEAAQKVIDEDRREPEEKLDVYKSPTDKEAHKKVLLIWSKLPEDTKNLITALRAAFVSWEEIITADDLKSYLGK